MNKPSEIKVWKLTPEQMASYTIGQPLGEPHRVEQYQSNIKNFDTPEKWREKALKGAETRRAKHMHKTGRGNNQRTIDYGNR